MFDHFSLLAVLGFVLRHYREIIPPPGGSRSFSTRVPVGGWMVRAPCFVLGPLFCLGKEAQDDS